MQSSRPPARNPAWLAYVGMALAVAGIIYQGGQLTSAIQNNDRRITRLEAADTARSDSLNSINVRTARIEAKLDFYMPKETAR